MKDVFTILLNLAKRIKASFTKLTTLETWQSGVTDYIVEQGTSGNWIYRKYASGIAECWGRYQYTTTGWNQWGGLYEAVPRQQVDYPSGLFTSVNSCNIFPNGIGAITLAGVEVSGNSGGSTTRTPYFYATRGATSVNNTVGVSIHAIGRWKEN